MAMSVCVGGSSLWGKVVKPALRVPASLKKFLGGRKNVCRVRSGAGPVNLVFKPIAELLITSGFPEVPSLSPHRREKSAEFD